MSEPRAKRLRSPATLTDAAFAAVKAGRYSEAVDLARQAVRASPADARARSLLARALDGADRPAEAAEVVAGLLRDQPGQVDFLYWYAVLLRRAGRAEEALPIAMRLATLAPQRADLHAHLGVIQADLSRLDDAVASFRRAAELDPASAVYTYNLATTLLRGGHSAEAETLLRGLGPSFAAGQLALGELLVKCGRAEEAVPLASRTLGVDGGSARAHLLMAHALSDRTGAVAGDFEEAERHIRRALELEPGSATAHGRLGYLLQERGRFEEAFDAFDQAIRIDPSQGALYYGLATSRKFAKCGDELAQRLIAALADTGLPDLERAYIHYGLGKILEDGLSFGAAMDHYDAGNALMFDVNAKRRPFDASELERRTSWIIETFDREFIARHAGLGSSSSTPIFVVGMMRSGTTLLEQILSSHPSVTGAGELMFWNERAGEAFAQSLDALDRGRIERLCADYSACLRAVSSAAERVTDKMPQNTPFLGLIHIAFPNARIIHCRRHPVDTCLSIYTTPYSVSPDFAHRRVSIVAAYRQYLRLMQHWRETLPPERFIEIDYEALVGEPEPVIRRLVDFVALPWSDACLRHELNERAVKTPSRWQVRQPLYRSSVARWKRFEPWLGEFRDLLTDADRGSD